MGQRGRPTSAAAMIDRLKGAPPAKERFLVILSNLAGTTPVAEACRKLGLGRTQFWSLRTSLLEASLRALEPRPKGRPVVQASLQDRQIQELKEEIERLKESLEIARVREEIALLLPWIGRRQKRARRTRRPKPGAMPSDLRAG